MCAVVAVRPNAKGWRDEVASLEAVREIAGILTSVELQDTDDGGEVE
jgi:hypothetical protein